MAELVFPLKKKITATELAPKIPTLTLIAFSLYAHKRNRKYYHVTVNYLK